MDCCYGNKKVLRARKCGATAVWQRNLGLGNEDGWDGGARLGRLGLGTSASFLRWIAREVWPPRRGKIRGDCELAVTGAANLAQPHSLGPRGENHVSMVPDSYAVGFFGIRSVQRRRQRIGWLQKAIPPARPRPQSASLRRQWWRGAWRMPR